MFGPSATQAATNGYFNLARGGNGMTMGRSTPINIPPGSSPPIMSLPGGGMTTSPVSPLGGGGVSDPGSTGGFTGGQPPMQPPMPLPPYTGGNPPQQPLQPPYGGGNPPMKPLQPPYGGGNPPMQPIGPMKPPMYGGGQPPMHPMMLQAMQAANAVSPHAGYGGINPATIGGGLPEGGEPPPATGGSGVDPYDFNPPGQHDVTGLGYGGGGGGGTGFTSPLGTGYTMGPGGYFLNQDGYPRAQSVNPADDPYGMSGGMYAGMQPMGSYGGGPSSLMPGVGAALMQGR